MTVEQPLVLLFEKQIERQAVVVSSALIDSQPVKYWRIVRSPLEHLEVKHIFFEIEDSLIISGLELTHQDGSNAEINDLNGFRSFLAEVLHIGQTLGAAGVFWRPSLTVTGFFQFEKSVESFIDGGPFPALSFVQFIPQDNGGIYTKGLGQFCGQNMIFEPSRMPEIECVRRMVRITHDMVTNGPYCASQVINGLVDGEVIELSPVQNGKFVEISLSAKAPTQITPDDPHSN